MSYTETLIWRLDSSAHGAKLEADLEKSADFIRSLGLESEGIGWCKVDLSAPECDEMLDRIGQFCKQTGMKARGHYIRKYRAADSEWYRLKFDVFRAHETSDTFETVKDARGKDMELEKVRAYTLTGSFKESLSQHCVPASFMDACIANNLNDLRFCWLRDVGRYAGTQYFAVLPEERVERVIGDFDYRWKASSPAFMKLKPMYKTMVKLGGKLPKLAEVFGGLTISLPNSYLRADLPNANFAYAYVPQYFLSKNDLLIRKEAAEKLISCGVLHEDQLEPVCVCDAPISGYTVKKTAEKPFPDDAVLAERMDEYKTYISKEHPPRTISEKEAVKLLKLVKTERPEDFEKPLPKKRRDELTATEFAPLIPYYSVCGSGYLCDEYRLLDISEAKEETTHLNELGIEGTAIVECGDTDMVLLTPNGNVVQIERDEPYRITSWDSLAAFFMHAIK